MGRASRNLCFLLAVTVVNVTMYLAMSGNFAIFKSSGPAEKTNNNALRLAGGDRYQDLMSQLVKEAVRDRGFSHHNLSVMLEKAMREHTAGSAAQTDSGDSTFIQRGKTEPINRTADSSVSAGEKKDADQNAAAVFMSRKLVPDVEVEDIANRDPLTNKEEPLAPKPPDKKEEGVLSHIGNFFTGSREGSKPVVLPHEYNLVLNEPNKCKNEDGSDRPVFFLVLIMSIHKNFDQRNAIRRTWGSPKEIDGKQIVTLFLLAKNTNENHQRLVEQESRQYHDLLMEDFVDTYKNLTLKTMMGMKWASIFCPHADFFMKTDDDMYISYANVVQHLAKSITPTQNYVTGFVINGGPIRDPKSKWYMARETYPGSKYPPFCSGTGYMMSGDMPGKIFQTSLNTPFLYLEDVYVAVCLHTLHVVPVNNKGFNNWRTPYSYCKFKRIFTTHMVTPTEMYRIWNDQQTSKGYHCFI